jgi:hypothetical protein
MLTIIVVILASIIGAFQSLNLMSAANGSDNVASESWGFILNGGFETGAFDNWTAYGRVGPPQGIQVVSTFSHSGKYCCWIPGDGMEVSGYVEQNITSDVFLSGDIFLDCWIYPEKVGPLMTEYPFSGIELVFENTIDQTTYYLDFLLGGYVWTNSSERGIITLFDFTPNMWNHLQRDLRDDLYQLIGNDPSQLRLVSISISHHWSNEEPGGFFIDDVSLTQRIKTRITILTYASSAYVGFHVNLTGVLGDQNGLGIGEANVTLFYTVPGFNNWIPITSVGTSVGGEYSSIWIPFATGYFILMAEWAGNQTYTETSNSTTLSIVPYENQYVFSVVSNSTVSSLAFNSTSNELTFTVSDPSGTRGFTDVTIAKSLVANATDLKVYLNGTETSYSILSTDDSWLVQFSYIHSVHSVVIDLSALSSGFFALSPLEIIVIAIASAGVITGVAIVMRSRKKASIMSALA